MNRFDEMLLAYSVPERWKKALIDVADTAFICWVWLDERKVPFSAADVLTMTKMVIDREDALAAEEAAIEQDAFE